MRSDSRTGTSRGPCSKKQDYGTSRLWVLFTMLFGATSVALAAYLIYVKAFEQKETTSREEKIIRRFSGFFRALEDQAKFEDQYMYSINATLDSEGVTGTDLDMCDFSSRLFISPDTAVDIDGRTVSLAQLPSQRQYFPSQTCKHADGCTGCRCAQELMYVAAVVEPADDDNTDNPRFIGLPGCCKCFNA